jgi:hypothetical protein
MYNPLQFFKPVNARFDLAGQTASQISEQNRLRDARAKQEQQQQTQRAGAEKYIGLQGLMQSGALEGDEEGLRIAQEGMQGGALDALGAKGLFDFNMKQQQAEARRRKEEALSDPRVQELMVVQKDSNLKAKGLVSKYLNTDSLEEKQAIEEEYMNLSKISNEAGAELGSNPAISGWQYTAMPNFYRMVESAVKGRGAQGLQEIEKETKEYARDKIKVESEAIEEKTKLSKQKQQADLLKMAEERGRTKHNQITKVLNDSNLLEPTAYDAIVDQGKFMLDNKNIFGAVKLLSNIIEPGLSVTEGEVGGYTIGGQGVVAKMLMDTFGAGTSDINGIYTLLKGLADRKKVQAQSIVDAQGERSNATPNATKDDPLRLF